MAKEVQGLKWLIGADARDFKKGMAEAQKASRTFKRESGKAFDEFAAAFGINMRSLRQSVNTFKSAVISLGGASKGAAAGTGLLTKAMKLLKVALISTGIGALVVALGSLIAYFTKTQRGADKLSQVMEGVGAIFAVLIDRASAFGEGIFKIFTGDFKGGWDALKNSLKGIGQEMVTEAREASALEKALNALEDREIELSRGQAQRRLEVAKLRAEAEKLNYSEKERADFLKQAMDLEAQSLQENLDLQRERVRIMTDQVNLGESSRDEIAALADEENKLYQLEEDYLNRTRRLLTKEQSLSAQATREQTEEIKEQVKSYRELREEQDRAFDRQLEIQKEMIKPVQAAGVDTTTLAPVSFLSQEQIDAFRSQMEEMRGVVIDISSEINTAMNSMAVGFGESIGNMISGASGFETSLSQVILSPLADMAVQIGKIAIGAGIALEGIRNAFASMNPALAIAAGIALVALGTAVKGALQNVVSGGSGSTQFTSVSGGYDGRGLQTSSNIGTQQAMQIEIVGETTIKNRDIYIAYKSAETSKKLNT